MLFILFSRDFIPRFDVPSFQDLLALSRSCHRGVESERPVNFSQVHALTTAHWQLATKSKSICVK
jgi:hypothetical protein